MDILKERGNIMKTEPTTTLDRIKDLMENGIWSEAIDKFKHLNCSAREYQEYLDGLYSPNTIRDFALLGFYTKETIFD